MQFGTKESAVYKRIIEYKIRHKGTAPTIKEIMRLTGYKSAQSVHHHLTTLEHLGLITRNFREPRSTHIVGEKWLYDAPGTIPTGTAYQIYSYVVGKVAGEGAHPSYDEIAEAVGLVSKSTVGWHLDRLRAQGLINVGNGHRALTLPGATYTIELDSVPSLGQAAAASAIAAAQPKKERVRK